MGFINYAANYFSEQEPRPEVQIDLSPLESRRHILLEAVEFGAGHIAQVFNLDDYRRPVAAAETRTPEATTNDRPLAEVVDLAAYKAEKAAKDKQIMSNMANSADERAQAIAAAEAAVKVAQDNSVEAPIKVALDNPNPLFDNDISKAI